MKKILILMLLSYSLFFLYSGDENNIIKFKGINLSESEYKNITDNKYNYNLAYSPLLPSDAIYSAFDNITGKEVIIQIGYAKVNTSPDVIYLPENIFNYFANVYDEKVEKINLTLKFLAWNKNDLESSVLNIQNLIVKPENSYDEINKNGLDSYYIQIGAFSYYQNSYILIEQMMPMLKILPRFYFIKNTKSKKKFYKILAGPYSLETAKSITKEINTNSKKKTFIQSGESLIYQNSKNKKDSEK